MTLSALADLLAAWLPRQRWFAGGNGGISAVEITSDVQLAAGDPELRHLIVTVRLGGEAVSYQILAGFRTHLPDWLDQARIGATADGRVAYDGASDPELTAIVLRGIAAQRVAGPLRFASEPGALIEPGATGRMLPPLQSNTSIVFGDKAILKLLRRPYEGHHPDLEVPAALARNGSRLVAAPLGWIELAGGEPAGAGTGEPTVLAILSEYFPHARDGWSLATASLSVADPDFSGEAGLLGQTTARMHAELAAAFGTSDLSRSDLAGLAGAMTAELERAAAIVPELAGHRAAIEASYADLTQLSTTVAVQRIHGDYHLAQVLGTEGGWVVLDFEGEPSVPLAHRRAFASALRDVAGMLRSFDYAARHQVLRRPGDEAFKATALDWVRNCQDAFLAGYAAERGGQPEARGPLLRALTFQKAVYEAVYEARHRPDWLPIPLAAIAEAGA